MTMDVFDSDGGVIDQDADRQSETTKRHRIHRLSEGTESDD
jgi:hypothetical protein